MTKGLVHRDFKPENVMVARSGEVRVMDFGLAREIEARAVVNGPVATLADKFGGVRTDGGTVVLHKQGTPEPATPPGQAAPPAPLPIGLANDDGVVRELRDTDPSAAADLFSARLTRTGAIMGTPAYMAPEQFFKAGTDARSDQFSFCVTLYEALYGERPFPGNNIQTLVGNIVQGNIRDPPPGTKVPSWIRKIVLRGLRPTAAERYGSMAEILLALKTDPRVKYRRIALGVTLALLPVAVAFGFRQLTADPGIVCTDGADRLSAIWELTPDNAPEAPHQRRVHDAFLSTGKIVRRGRLRDGPAHAERLRSPLVQHVQGDLRGHPPAARTVTGCSRPADVLPQRTAQWPACLDPSVPKAKRRSR